MIAPLRDLPTYLIAVLRDPLTDRLEQMLAAAPLLWCVIWLVPLVAVLAAVSPIRRRLMGARSPVASAALAVSALVVIAAYVLITWLYVLSPRYLDMVEPSVASISWYFATGRPVYHPLESAQLYSNLYGPALYVLNGLALDLAGPSIPSSKIVGVLAANVALALLFLAFRRESGSRVALIGVGVTALIFLTFRHASFFARSEPLLVACVAAALYAAGRPAGVARAVLLGLAAGVSLNLKAHGLLYMLPPAMLAVQAFSRRELVVGLVVAVVTAGAPFVLPNVSLPAYADLLRQASRHGLDFNTYLTVLQSALGLVLPVLILFMASLLENGPSTVKSVATNRNLVIATGVAVALLLIPASKSGAGPHHLLPFVPIVVFLGLRLLRDGAVLSTPPGAMHIVFRAAAYSWLLCASIVAVWNARDLRWQTDAERNRLAAALLADVDRIHSRYATRYEILMGVGGDQGYPRTYYRPHLVFKTGLIGIDPAALMDFEAAHHRPPDLHRLEASTGDGRSPRRPLLWLIPKGEQPFSMQTLYSSGAADSVWEFRHGLFNPTFRREFASEFARIEDDGSPYYDLYVESRGSDDAGE